MAPTVARPWTTAAEPRLPASSEADTTSGFKCWRREALEAIDLNRLFSNGYLFQIETSYMAFRKKLRIAEVPIVFVERRLGRSKMNWGVIAEALLGVFRMRLRR